MQTDLLNDAQHPTVIVLPISSMDQPENILRLKIENPGLHRGQGYVLIDQPRAIDVDQRLKKKTGHLSEAEMIKVGKLMLITLELIRPFD